MKKVCLLLCIMLLISGCTTKSKDGEEKLPSDVVEIELSKKDNCDNDITEYYTRGNQKIYFVCLNEIMIPKENCSLSYYLNQVDKDFEEKLADLKSSLKEVEVYKDGGTKIYKNDTTTIIVCHAMQENDKYNEDIYIGDENLEFQQDFCTREIY